MKKLISIITVLSIVFAVAACGTKNTDVKEPVENNETEISVENESNEAEETINLENEKEDVKTEDKKEEAKPEVLPPEKPVDKPVEAPAPEAKPEATNQSVGNVLLSEFKGIAASNSVEEIANILVTNPIIKFSGAAVPVSEGFLTGFDNTEIKGFKEGVMFAPMIGTIPFVGYVFELSDGVDASSFISTLKSSANLRWNICTQADEIVTGSVGNKVFFVMSKITLDEEE